MMQGCDAVSLLSFEGVSAFIFKGGRVSSSSFMSTWGVQIKTKLFK